MMDKECATLNALVSFLTSDTAEKKNST